VSDPVEPLSYRLLSAIQTQLSYITKDHGFFTDAGGSVGLEPIQQDGSAPQILVVETDDESADQPTLPQGQYAMTILVESAVPASSADAQIQAHRVRDDVIKAMARKTNTAPNGVSGLKLISRKILQRPDGMPAVVAQCMYRATLIERDRA
jgi:hypothetical protein